MAVTWTPSMVPGIVTSVAVDEFRLYFVTVPVALSKVSVAPPSTPSSNS